MMPFAQTRTFSKFDATHVIIDSTKPFANVQAFLEAVIPDIVLKRDDGQTVLYEIALAAATLTRYNPAVLLYTPLRVVLYENDDGGSRFEYDLPSSMFAQFGDDRIMKVGRELDDALLCELAAAAG